MNSILNSLTQKIEFNIDCFQKTGLARTGSLVIRSGKKVVKIKTPILWLTCTVNGSPQIWKELKEVRHIMLSCYDILQHKRMYVERLLTSNNYRDIHKELEFEGYIFMDSGGFQFLRNKNINITPKTIFDIQNKSQADLASILDYPFHPKASIKEKINSIQTTLNNLKIYKSFIQKENTNTLFMPVIHGHDPVTLIKMAKKVRKIFGDEALCIGSLVPVLFPVKYGTIKDVARAFVEVRKVLPNSFIHVFGAGSSLSSHLFFYLGADSVDSATWIIKAGFGNIHLPGQGAAYITSDGRRSRCRFVDWNKYECECPVCRDKAPDEILKEMDRHDSYGRKLRAIHNAWVYLKEIEIVRNSIVEGEYENLVRQRMRNTSLRNIFETFTQIVKP